MYKYLTLQRLARLLIVIVGLNTPPILFTIVPSITLAFVYAIATLPTLPTPPLILPCIIAHLLLLNF